MFVHLRALHMLQLKPLLGESSWKPNAIPQVTDRPITHAVADQASREFFLPRFCKHICLQSYFIESINT